MYDIFISPEIEAATKRVLADDTVANEIDEISHAIEVKASEIAELEGKLNRFKTLRAKNPIPWKSSTLWCLAVDSKNPKYFLKSTVGTYKCVAFKNKVDVSSDIKNKVAITLANLFRDGHIGRITINKTHYYGLLTFFKENKTDIKDEYIDDLEKLIL